MWDGRQGSLRGGLSGLFVFQASIDPQALVETSAFEYKVRWDLYCAAKALARLIDPDADPQKFQYRLRDVLLYAVSQQVSMQSSE